MSNLDELRKEYVVEFYIRAVEGRIGYRIVSPRREALADFARGVLEDVGADASMNALLEFFLKPYMVSYGVVFCILLDMTDLFMDMIKEEKKQ